MAVPKTDAGFAIGARNASKLFLDGAVVAFRQLTLDVRNQEILCIVGPSGCGKTTFLRLSAVRD
jgi:ABC-type Fe3+/spermidine/putrescine transport system ATPase subunit